MMSWLHGLLWGVTVALLVGCAGVTERKINWAYAAFHPPPEYVVWWEETEDCLGMRYEFSKVTWLVVAGGRFDVAGFKDVLGYAFHRPYGAVVMISQKFWLTARVVRHEAIHAITGLPHFDADNPELPYLAERTFIKCDMGPGP